MAKITNPIRLSDHFDFDEALLAKAGTLNPTLNIDTRLFVDPLLLSYSGHHEMRVEARSTYETHFTAVIKLLRASRAVDDVGWRNAQRLLSFPEIKGTCLGYGAQSVSGSGSGSEMPASLIRTAKEIVDLGVDDPDLFIAMALFEEGFGPDRISDMTTNVILQDLLRFNERILPALPVPREPIQLRLRNGQTYDVELPINPFIRARTPVILVPFDVLRDLPIATDWAEVGDAASKNEEIRQHVNEDIAKLWEV